MNQRPNGLTEEIISAAEKHGMVLMGTAKIYEVNTAIVIGTPLNEKWRLGYPIVTEAKRIYEEQKISKLILTSISKVLKNEGFENTKHLNAVKLFGDFRPLAVEAGIAHRGRNGLAINKKFSAGMILSAIITNAPIEIKSEPEILECSKCELCVELCPANALSDGRLNYKKCLPYTVRGCAQCLKACGYATH